MEMWICKIQEELTMKLQDYKIDGEYITISKKDLQELASHYYGLRVSYDQMHDPSYRAYYAGKEKAMMDLLSLF